MKVWFIYFGMLFVFVPFMLLAFFMRLNPKDLYELVHVSAFMIAFMIFGLSIMVSAIGYTYLKNNK